MADGLSMGVEDKPDAIVDIATLTGAAMGALGNGGFDGTRADVHESTAKLIRELLANPSASR